MIKLVKSLLAVILVLSAFTLKAGECKNGLENYLPEVHGELRGVLKSQDSYHSPFDVPAWGWDARAGASNRNTQFYRLKGDLHFTWGKPGNSEFFTVMTLNFDANDPDNISGDFDKVVDSEGNILTDSKLRDAENNKNKEENKVEITNAFVMWRPFKVAGGRPFGITLGKQTVKQTANGAYSHFFRGDLDDDFIAYSITSLINKPMINLDFHIDEKTGIGYSFARGANDFSQNSAGFADEYSLTHTGYLEAEKFNIGLNAAYQYTMGNREETDWVKTPYGNNFNLVNGESADGTYKEANYDYKSYAFNAGLYYKLNLGEDLMIKPFAGYQLSWGEIAPPYDYQVATIEYNKKENESSVLTAGFEAKMKIGKFPVTLAAEYSDVSTPDFDGLGGVDDGQIDIAAGTFDIGAFKGIAGDSKVTYTIAGLDYMYQAEATVELSKNFSVTAFYKHQAAQDVEKLLATDEQKTKVGDVVFMSAVSQTLGTTDPAVITAFLSDPNNAGVIAQIQEVANANTNMLIQSLDSINQYGTEWTDSDSFGLEFTFTF